MNLSALSAQVGNITSSQSVANDNAFVNEAAHDMYEADRWSWLESKTNVALVAGQKGYVVLGTSPVITDCAGVYACELVLTTSAATKPLSYYPPQLFVKEFGHTFTNTQPSGWSLIGGTAATTSATVVSGGQQSLTLNYPPLATAGSGQSINIYYWRSAASVEMAATTDVPIAPVPLHRLIVTRACAIAMERNLMFSEAAGYQRSYDEGLARAMDADKANRFSDFQQMELRPLPVGNPQGAAPKAVNAPYPVAS